MAMQLERLLLAVWRQCRGGACPLRSVSFQCLNVQLSRRENLVNADWGLVQVSTGRSTVTLTSCVLSNLARATSHREVSIFAASHGEEDGALAASLTVVSGSH